MMRRDADTPAKLAAGRRAPAELRIRGLTNRTASL